MLKMVSRILCEGIVCNSTGLIMCGVYLLSPYTFMLCTGTTECYVDQTGIYLCVIFVTFFHFIHWELEMCLFPLHHRTLSF
jgi:hypothetical protein